MATINRKDEVDMFCRRLNEQTYRNFELIIVDQNLDGRLDEIISQNSYLFKIKHIKSSEKGLSRNRNIGLEYTEGNVTAFPDDDCEYQKDTLQKIAESFLESEKDFVACNSIDKKCNVNHFIPSVHDITFKNIYRSAISYTVFIQSSCIEDFRFDEQLGVGAAFGAGEETDLIAWLLSRNRTGRFFGNIYIEHPYKGNDYNLIRCSSYALGFGALYKKLITYYKAPYAKKQFFIAVVKNIIALIISRHKKYYFTGLKYKLKGLVSYKYVIEE